MFHNRLAGAFLLVCFVGLIGGCPGTGMNGGDDTAMDDGPIADGITAKMGDPFPSASAEQMETFQRGREVFLREWKVSEGLGPAFNIAFCGGCHERPQPGGSAGLYRNFFLGGRLTGDGAFIPAESAGDAGGVIRFYDFSEEGPPRPEVPDDTTIIAQRNPIPFFGVGLLAELSDEEILSRADPDDEDGDGISGRANFDRGFVGRFGRKSQTVSIEGFIRGPLFNHVGITSDPLSDEMRALLPVDSSADSLTGKVRPRMQAAAPDAPTTDDDAAPDPELAPDELFDLISFAMLLAAPELDEPTEQSNQGRLLFHEAGCSGCHTPRIEGPRGPVHAYSDLLLHDMGEALADGIVQGEATGSEFRTQPLWGLSAVGPYLHDGRAETIRGAILAHGGEGEASRDAFDAMSETEKEAIEEFLLSLGGRDQYSTGLLEPDTPVADVGEYAGPFREMDEEETARYTRGRELFDREFGFDTGAGGLQSTDGSTLFNGDSCRACHFAPVIGGAGPAGVNVMRHGSMDDDGIFVAPLETPNTILHKVSLVGDDVPRAGEDVNVFEHRQTPAAFGLGLIEAISDETIIANADPDDEDMDGISGRAHILEDGRLGRFGWKAQVPSIAEFVRDAMAAEIGLTVAAQDGLTFGITEDNDEVPDPELQLSEAEDLAFFISMMAGPPRQAIEDEQSVANGETLFGTVGCTSCHIPSMTGSLGEVPLYSDLLLHEILAEGQAGIGDGDATPREFRTAPLWGISQTGPYFHTGQADTIDEAIRMHDGEAAGVRGAYEALSDDERADLLAFLGSL
ncbi:MAG: di-heme oxidoredictase family protein [Planctomycetota bacterium]|jgi:CxxC motif-containing protein (DUF1111 family)